MAKKEKKPSILPSLLKTYDGDKYAQLTALSQEWRGCKRCPLGDMRSYDAQSLPDMEGIDVVFGDGNPEADVLIVGEAPGEEEMKYCAPFVGPSGKLLNQILAATSDNIEVKRRFKAYNSERRHTEESSNEFAMDIREWRQSEFFITNAVGCRPPENRPPIPPEVNACWERLWNIIYIIDPLIIIACGNSALAAVAQRRNAKITRERGNLYDVVYEGRLGTMSYPVLPVFHPSYLLRKGDWNVKDGDWAKTLQDFNRAMTLVDRLRYQYYGTPIPNRTPL